jgi:mRNA interferase RelE/StbE
MPYKVEFSREAVDDLRHLDKAVAQRILRRLRWLSDNFDTAAPEALTAEMKGLFKFRVGS